MLPNRAQPARDAAADKAKHSAMRQLRFPSKTLTSHVDLRPWMSPVENQKSFSACSANAFAGVLEYLTRRHYGLNIDVSRLFIYYNSRLLDGHQVMQDQGTFLNSTAEAIRRFGGCEERFWPYEAKLVDVQPNSDVYREAKRFTVTPVKIPLSLTAIKKALNNGFPVVIGIVLHHSADREARDRGGPISIPDPFSTTIRNAQIHAVVFCGYNDNTQHFIMRNSWGKDWGLQGYCYLPYKYLSKPELVNSGDGVWTIRDIQYRTPHLPTVRLLHVTGHGRDRSFERKENLLINHKQFRTPQLFRKKT